jgi:hypothetical protein
VIYLSSVFDISFTIDAAVSGTFAKTFSNATKTMETLQKKMSALSKNQAAIASFGKLQAGATQTAERLNVARNRVRELGEQMRATATPSEQLKKRFAQAQAAKLQEKLVGQRNELRNLKTSLSAAGINTKNFSNDQARRR